MRKIYVLLTSICLVFLFIHCSSIEDDPVLNPLPSAPLLNKIDSIAMVNIYNKIGPWGNEWNLSDIQTWGGVTITLGISENEYRITEFKYDGSFKGKIPEDFLNLKELRVLGLGGGKLHGNIPAWIGDLDKLESLYIGYNKITGSIPPSIGKLKNLRFTKIKRIILDQNKLSGEFPLEILNSKFTIECSYNNITKLDFNVWSDKNNLFPPDLQFNRLSGIIPDSIKTNKKWEEYNFLVGTQQDGYGYKNLD